MGEMGPVVTGNLPLTGLGVKMGEMGPVVTGEAEGELCFLSRLVFSLQVVCPAVWCSFRGFSGLLFSPLYSSRPLPGNKYMLLRVI